MLSKEECEAIRARCEAATPGEWSVGFEEGVKSENGYVIWGNEFGLHMSYEDTDFIAHSRQDIPALLDALEEAEAKYEHINNFDNTQSVKLLADRDRWKARTQALERAICEYSSVAHIKHEPFKCMICEHWIPEDAFYCKADEACSCGVNNWQFDESRFAGEMEGEGS